MYWSTNSWGGDNTPLKLGFVVEQDNTPIDTIFLDDWSSTSYTLTQTTDGSFFESNKNYFVYLEKWYNTSDYITSDPITLMTLDLPPIPTLTLTTTWNNVDAGDIVLEYDATTSPPNTVVVNYKLEGAQEYTSYTLGQYDADGNTIIPDLEAGDYVVQLIYTYT